MAADRRLSAATFIDSTAMLRAADELQTATENATVWLPKGYWPDSKFWMRAARLRNTSTDVALTWLS